jgi:penicillin-binding protein 1A
MKMPSWQQFLLILTVGFAIISAGLYFYIDSVVSGNLPSLAQLENPPQERASQVLSSNGEQIALFANERRINLNKSQIPEHFFEALIATEDRAFYEHWGVHMERLFKAVFKNVFQGRREGASTITQQLAGNLFTGRERSIERKLKEAFTAVKIEETYTKDQILVMYANTVNFGRGNYGIDMAARSFFNKKPRDLTVAESAYLVAKVKAPANYDATRNYDKALNRRNLVLKMMAVSGYLSAAEYELYRSEEIVHVESDADIPISGIAPHFVEDIRQELRDSEALSAYDLYGDGLRIRTTLNERIQMHALRAVDKHIAVFQEKMDSKFKWSRNEQLLGKLISKSIREHPSYISAEGDEGKSKVADKLRGSDDFVDSVKNSATTIQVGLVVLSPKTGEILAMVGASPKFMRENKYARYSLNHVTGISRQPGSILKPFVYASALKNGLTPDDSVGCGPFVYTDPVTDEVWAPRSGTRQCPDEDDKMTVRQGLTGSVNSVAARLITQYTTPKEVIRLLRNAGVESKLYGVPALALGAGGELSPMEVTEAFNIFANAGYHVDPYYISRIQDESGKTIYNRNKVVGMNEVISSTTQKEMTAMLQGVIDGGTGGRVRNHLQGVDAAGKTGTTNDGADAWFVGYTPELICGIWVGFDDQRINFEVIGNDGQGGRAAAPIWGMLMESIYSDESLGYDVRQFENTNPFIPDEETTVEEIDATEIPEEQETVDEVF